MPLPREFRLQQVPRATTHPNPFRLYFASIPHLEECADLSYRGYRGGLGRPQIGGQRLHPRQQGRDPFIIGHNERDTEREAAIRALDDGRSYRLLLEEFYPGLRRTTFSLSFDVRPYTVEELPGIFETKPECLSQHEMYQLAGLYASRGCLPFRCTRGPTGSSRMTPWQS